MLKILGIICCLSFMFGCQPAQKYTTSEEYVEEREWDREKGLIECSNASWGISWNN
jgi:hypothetical protein